MLSDALAHDLKGPLLTMTQFGEHLHEAASDSLDEQQGDYLQRIRTAGKQMTRIIDDLRDLAEADREEITQEEVDVSSLGPRGPSNGPADEQARPATDGCIVSASRSFLIICSAV